MSRKGAGLSAPFVELVCDAPLPEPLEELSLKGIPPEPLKEFLEDMGFKSLLTRMVTSESRNQSWVHVAVAGTVTDPSNRLRIGPLLYL